jgi:hypothetical protein
MREWTKKSDSTIAPDPNTDEDTISFLRQAHNAPPFIACWTFDPERREFLLREDVTAVAPVIQRMEAARVFLCLAHTACVGILALDRHLSTRSGTFCLRTCASHSAQYANHELRFGTRSAIHRDQPGAAFFNGLDLDDEQGPCAPHN